MKLKEREETTKYACSKIKEYLHEEDFTSALMLSSIYVNIRLRTVVTDRLYPPKRKWGNISRKLDIGFNRLLNLCEELDLLYGFDKRILGNLWKKRCNVAHESRLWKQLSRRDKDEIESICKAAMQFLEKTSS